MFNNFISNIRFRELLTCIMLGFLLSVQHAYAQKPPDGVLALRPEGYAYADYPGIFSPFDDDGITIEIWFYITEAFPPEGMERERWVLIAKPGCYSIRIGVGNMSMGLPDPEGTIYIEYNLYAVRGSFTTGLPLIPGDPDYPLDRWVYTAFQIKGVAFAQRAIFLDKKIIVHGDNAASGTFADTSDPLFVGGRPGYSSLKGWVDEMHISKGWRYGAHELNINPQRRFQADHQTVALWHFDEGAWAANYADSWVHGYTLLTSGLDRTISVDNDGKLATKWGHIKHRCP